MYLSFFDRRLVTKAVGIDSFHVKQTHGQFIVNTTIGSEKSTISLEDYQDKWFIVENTDSDVDCRKHQVEGLVVAECKGKIQVRNFFG